MSTVQILFQIHESDNVGTLLHDVSPGDEVLHRGEGSPRALQAAQSVKVGHKLALCSIACGHPVVKYGIQIGVATAPIEAGAWVHLHNCASRYDQKSSHLDIDSGAPTETRYA
jgi:hypothetical protein